MGQPRLPSFLAQVEATRVALAEIGVVQVGMVASEAVCVEPLRGDRPPGGDPVESVGRADSELQRPLQPVPCVSGSVVCFSRMEQLGVGAQRAAERASDLQEAERRGTLPIRAHYQTVMSCRSPISAPLARCASALAPSDVVLVETAAETVPGSQLDLGEQSAADVADDLVKGARAFRRVMPPAVDRFS